MGRNTTSRSGALPRMLANGAALVAVCLFLAHAVAAERLPHPSGPAAAHSERSLAPSDAVGTSAVHDYAKAVGQDHYAASAKLACCGDVCLSALIHGENPCPRRSSREGSKPFVLSSLMSGRTPEGLRRPPWLPA